MTANSSQSRGHGQVASGEHSTAAGVESGRPPLASLEHPSAAGAPHGKPASYGSQLLRKRVRNSDLVKRHPGVLAGLRAVSNGIDLLRMRKNRSYFHGLLFDLKGGIYRTEGMAFRIADEQFPRSYRSRLYFDIYEAPERALVRKWVRPEASVLELGGCVGVVSCVVNKLLVRPQSHIVVEANPTLIDILEENRDANGCAFKIENCLVTQATEAEFFISKIMTANRKDSGIGRRVPVDVMTLEGLEAKHEVKFDTLILDIEGGEYDLFTENAERLAAFNVIILELHRRILSPRKIETCTTLLEKAGMMRVDAQDETEVWTRR